MNNYTELNSKGCSLCVSGVHFDIGPQQETLHCHCEIPHGRMVGVLGPNGCGKSSLFKALVGEIPYSGDISYFGKTLAQVKHQVGYLPQHLEIPPDFPITVQEFIAAGSPGYFKFKWPWQRRTDSQRNQMFMDRMGIEHLNHSQIANLSGGEQRRVYLTRLLLQDSQLLFLDEPLAGVDEKGEDLTIDIFKDMTRAGKTLLVVHHDWGSVPEMFDEVLVFRYGRIEHLPDFRNTTLLSENALPA